jgi:hypothetical protein
MCRKRVPDGADVLRRGLAFGPDERQAVLKFAQRVSRCRIQQSVDRRRSSRKACARSRFATGKLTSGTRAMRSSKTGTASATRPVAILESATRFADIWFNASNKKARSVASALSRSRPMARQCQPT